MSSRFFPALIALGLLAGCASEANSPDPAATPAAGIATRARSIAWPVAPIEGKQGRPPISWYEGLIGRIAPGKPFSRNWCSSRWVPREAAEKITRKALKELRKEYVTASLLGVPIILGNSAAAKGIGAAMGQFVMKPGKLVVHAKSKEPAGIGFIDLGAARSPAAVLDRLEVEAKAN